MLCSVSIIFHHKSAISVIFDGRVAVHALFVAQICVELKNTNKFKDISNKSFPDPYPSLLNIFFLLNEFLEFGRRFDNNDHMTFAVYIVYLWPKNSRQIRH